MDIGEALLGDPEQGQGPACAGRGGLIASGQRRERMTWETPVVTEVAVGLEVTSYVSGDEGEGEI